MTTGCINELKTENKIHTDVNLLSFTESHSNNKVLFTDAFGQVQCFDKFTKSSILLLKSNQYRYSQVKASNASGEVALVRRHHNRANHPEFAVFGDQQLEVGDANAAYIIGDFPRFTADDQTIIFARADRFASVIGFGGGVWVDWDIWKYDRANNEIHRISYAKLFSISDIDIRPGTEEVFVSGIVSNNEEKPTERVFFCSSDNQLIDTEQGNTLGSAHRGQPAFTLDGSSYAFVSDREHPRHYALYLTQTDGSVKKLLFNGLATRYLCNPEYARTSASLYILAATSFSSDGQPELGLWLLRDDGTAEIEIAPALFGFKDTP
jgi:hypothetical protein